LDCPDVSPYDRPLICRLSVKIAPGQNVTAFIDYGDNSNIEEVVVNETSIWIKKQYIDVGFYTITCIVPEFNRTMSEKVYIRCKKNCYIKD
jgi:hypothetical protein